MNMSKSFLMTLTVEEQIAVESAASQEASRRCQVEEGITRANKIIQLRKRIWVRKKGTRDGAHLKKHDGAEKDLRPVPKVRRTKEEIRALEGGDSNVNIEWSDLFGSYESSDDSRPSTVSLASQAGGACELRSAMTADYV